MAAAAAAAAVMTAAGGGGAGTARSLSRFRGCLAGALLGDCVGAVYEAHDTVSLTSVLSHVESLEPDPGTPGSARTGGRGTSDRVATLGRGDRDSGAGALADEAAEVEAAAASSPEVTRLKAPGPGGFPPALHGVGLQP